MHTLPEMPAQAEIQYYVRVARHLNQSARTTARLGGNPRLDEAQRDSYMAMARLTRRIAETRALVRGEG